MLEKFQSFTPVYTSGKHMPITMKHTFLLFFLVFIVAIETKKNDTMPGELRAYSFVHYIVSDYQTFFLYYDRHPRVLNYHVTMGDVVKQLKGLNVIVMKASLAQIVTIKVQISTVELILYLDLLIQIFWQLTMTYFT